MSEIEDRWLSSTEASKLLGVHQTTLRRWADAGKVPCYRTPGGHRRFRAAELTAWMEGQHTSAIAPHSEPLLQQVVGYTRHEMVEQHVTREPWYVAFDREDERREMRETGHRLFGLAIQYVGRTSNREPVLREGQRIGDYYGQQCAQQRVSLVDTLRGFFFFRESLLRATEPSAVKGTYDAEAVRMHRQLRRFLDAVMYACLESYETACRRSHTSDPGHAA
jgi:excisionase family DNA binding protein